MFYIKRGSCSCIFALTEVHSTNFSETVAPKVAQTGETKAINTEDLSTDLAQAILPNVVEATMNYEILVERLAATSEISSLSVKEFIAGVLLGHHTEASDDPYMTTVPFVSEIEERHHLFFGNCYINGFQIGSHALEYGRKRGQKTCPYGCIVNNYYQHLSGTAYVRVIFLLIFRSLYNHISAAPIKCPNHPAFFQCTTKAKFEEIQDLNEVGPVFLWFRYSTMRDIVNNRKTRYQKSRTTGLYAIAIAFLRLAISLNFGEPYLTWARFENTREPGF
jgi:hypothetical protein